MMEKALLIVVAGAASESLRFTCNFVVFRGCLFSGFGGRGMGKK